MRLTGKRCQCAACGLYFSTEANFSAHRVGPYTARRCLTPEELMAKGYRASKQGVYVKATDEHFQELISRPLGDA